MYKLFSLAVAPVFILAFYMYIRDRYEKEPIKLLLTGLIYGVFIIVPIVHTEDIMLAFMPRNGLIYEALYSAFAVAALVEESYKYIILFFLVWGNNNFNERFDGIVYAVFISLGFAGMENLMYVFNPVFGGFNTAISRAVFSVPGHALFGVAMGYYFAIARFEPAHKFKFLVYALIVPVFLHGTYNSILMSGMPYLMLVFGAFVVYLWISALKKMKKHIQSSPFIPVIKNLG